MIFNKKAFLESFKLKNFILYLVFSLFFLLLFLLLNFASEKFTINNLLFVIVIFFFVFFLFIYFLEDMKNRDIERKINKELPQFLNNLANDLEKNISFKKALENRVDASILGQKIKLALYYTNKLGYPLSQGLQIICEGNSDFEKVVSQLEDIITSGNKNKAQVLR
ncbi:MAG: hypothetical protein V1824_03830, partial [archaeon]